LQGGVASTFRIDNEDGFPVRIRLNERYRDRINKMTNIMVATPSGPVPLASLGTITEDFVPALLTRQDMQNSIDIFGYKSRAALSHVMANVQRQLKGLKLPPGYRISQEGDAKQGGENFAALTRAMNIAMVLLYFSLIPAFRSFSHPLTIMTAIPLALIGAIWSLLLVGRTLSTAAYMGIILLAGIVVKNSILLIDFTEVEKERGESTLQALTSSVRVRTRPILMTAFGTAVGMLPIALERAIGLERLSPLAVVAIGGLMVSTFLTLLYVPIFYTIFEDTTTWLKNLIKRRQRW
jgi:multidrug efflux pump subunit AcrB